MLNTNSMLNMGQDEFSALQSQVLGLAKEFPNSSGGADALANALYNAISAGVPAAEAVDFLRVAARGATGGAVDTATAVGTMATALNAFKIPASQANEVSDLLFATVANGVTTYDQLGASLFQAAPAFASAGLGLDELLASVATLTKSGTPTSVAMTQMRQAIVALQNPNAVLSKTINELGYETGQAMLDAHGYQGTLELLADAAKNVDGGIYGMMGSSEAAAAVMGVTGINAATAAADIEAMGGASDGAGATMVAFDQKMSGLKNTWDTLMSVVHANAIAFGEKLAPTLKDVLGGVTDLLNGTHPLSPVLGTVADIAGGVFKAAFDGIPVVVGIVSDVFTFFANEVLPRVITAATAVHSWWTGVFPTVRDIVVPVIQSISSTISWLAENVLPVLLGWIQSVVNWVVANWPLIDNVLQVGLGIASFVISGFIEMFELLFSAVQDIWPSIQVIIETVMGVIAGIIETVMAIIAGDWGRAWEAIKGVFETLWNGIVEFIGTIPGLILGILKGLLVAAMAWAGGLAGKLLGWAAKFIGRFVGWFAQLPGRVMGAVGSLLGKILSFLGNLAVRGIKAIVNFIGKIVGWFTKLPGKAINAVSTLPGKLLKFIREIPGKLWDAVTNIGKSIMDGIIKGITGMIGNAVDAVTGAVGGIVDGALGFLGISSPSKVFEKIGRYSMEGLAKGLGDPRMAERALDRSLGSLTGRGLTLSGETVGALTGSKSGSPVHIENLHLPNVSNADEFVDALRHLGDSR